MSFFQKIRWLFLGPRWWQWACASLLYALVGIYLCGQMDFVPRDATARVSLENFRSELLSDPLPGAGPRVNNVKIYPEHQGVQLITYDLASITSEGIITASHFVYIQTGKSTAMDQFERTVASNGLTWQRVWWTGPEVSALVWLTGGILVIVVLLPHVIRWLTATFYEPKQPVATFNGTGPVQTKKNEPSKEYDTLDNPQDDDSVNDLPVDSQAKHTPAIAVLPPKKLSPEPIEVLDNVKCDDDRTYRGEFYPVELPRQTPKGFSIVELLVVIGILGFILAFLLPILSKARGTSEQLACAANLRSIGIGISMYVNENHETYPAAYLYMGQAIDGDVDKSSPTAGYLHWSSYLYGAGAIPQAAFHCPALDRGGLPPTDTTPDNLLPGIPSASPSIIDKQVPRLAYTLNEALCPRNKLVLRFQRSVRVYQFVRATQVENSSGTILATEFGPTAARIGDPVTGVIELVSHRPVHGFVGLDGTLDMYKLDPETPFRQVSATDLDADPATASESYSRLDWVGRNHGQKQGYPDRRCSNFLYADGHVETKNIYDTLVPFQWGRQFYSLKPHDDLQAP